jgi:putative SOS response-associated peptidase YedK
MCGRFVSARKRLELLEEFAVERDRVGGDRNPDYNVAPTKRIYAVLEHADKDAVAADVAAMKENKENKKGDFTSGHGGSGNVGASADGASAEEAEAPVARELRLLRWGLVPSWAKDAAGGARLINARAETVAVKPSFRSAFARRRCIIPADGYYEWQAPPEGSKVKQPFYIYRADGRLLCFAGIYELWRDGSVPPDHEVAWLWTSSIITTDATDEIGRIHDRTPMVVAPENWTDWLDPANNDKAMLATIMAPAMASGTRGLTSHRVSTTVNSVRNNGPDLIAPLRQDAQGGAGGAGGAQGSLF